MSWAFELVSDELMINGMSDNELELVCKPEFSGVAPWNNWTSEIYSFGKCLRHVTNYPCVLPLFVQGDHGVGLESAFYSHEERNGTIRIHFTWHPDKEKRYALREDKKVIRIPHPWILYRRSLGKVRSNNPKGTLVFLYHNVPGLKWEGYDEDEYFERLKELPDKFHPIVLCQHMHDINAGLHKALRRHGLPIVTAGNTSSTRFVDRFYDLVENFAYATSQGWGSQVAYCVEIGVPYFFFGTLPQLVNHAHEEYPLGIVKRYQDEFHEACEENAKKLFGLPVDSVTLEQRVFVESMLGMDSHITPEQISWILWKEFFHNWRLSYLVLVGMAIRFVTIIGIKPHFKRLWLYFRKVLVKI
jgi:hypothetical protein